MRRRPRVLTWHVHGNYLYYLTQADCDFFLPVADGKSGYSGRSGSFPWGRNVIEVPADEVRHLDIDCVIYQSRDNYLRDQHEILSEAQRRLPRIFIEHDPPRESPTDTRHVVDDPEVLLVHVTHFNALMWDSGRTPTRIIPHGVLVPDGVRYTGTKPKGIVVINNLATRGRRLGLDVYQYVSRHVPLDLVGMGSKNLGGLGEIPQKDLPAFMAEYRFFFNPIRYTSLGLAVCEAMTVGLPIVGLATTEMPVTVVNGESGWVDTSVDRLIGRMKSLLEDPAAARRLGEGARRHALAAFNIERFANDWLDTVNEVTGQAGMARAEGAQ